MQIRAKCSSQYHWPQACILSRLKLSTTVSPEAGWPSGPGSPLAVNCVRSLLQASRSASDMVPRLCRASSVKRMIGCTPLSSGGRCFSMATTCWRRRQSLTIRCSLPLPSSFNFLKRMSSTLPESGQGTYVLSKNSQCQVTFHGYWSVRCAIQENVSQWTPQEWVKYYSIPGYYAPPAGALTEVCHIGW